MKMRMFISLTAAMIMGASLLTYAGEAEDTPVEMLRAAVPGDVVYYGSYEQDNVSENGQEPISWRVLENTGDSLLLMSSYVLDGVPYSDAYINGNKWECLPVTWETCSLRAWLNSTFRDTAFTANEQTRLMTVLNKNTPSNHDSRSTITYTTGDGKQFTMKKTEYGNDTYDQVFLLSTDEIKEYIPFDLKWHTSYGDIEASSWLMLKSTPYAVAHGADVWSAATAEAAIQNNGGYAPFAKDIIGYTSKVALRTLDDYSENKAVRNIGANGAPNGTRTVTYDLSDCPAIRLDIR